MDEEETNTNSSAMRIMAGSLYYESDPYYHAGLHVDVDITITEASSFLQ